jgi:multimeric flavodoxin WrbA
VVVDALEKEQVEVSRVRLADLTIKPGVSSDEGDGDEWPGIHEQLLGSEILVVATPTWVGRPSSIAQRVLERMDAMLSETDDEGRPVAYNKVAGVVVTGNEDGEGPRGHPCPRPAGLIADRITGYLASTMKGDGHARRFEQEARAAVRAHQGRTEAARPQ